MSNTAGSRSDGFVDQLLLEAGLDGDDALRPALVQLRALADSVPEPSPELAALMAPAGVVPEGAAATTLVAPVIPLRRRTRVDAAATEAIPMAGTGTATGTGTAPVDELAVRRGTKRRVALTTLSVVVSLAAGGAVAVASDQQLRDSFSQLNQAVTSFIGGPAGTPVDNQAEQPAMPAGPALPVDPATVPAAPAPATQEAVVPPSDSAGLPAPSAGQATPSGKPAEVPGPETLPGQVPADIASGLSGVPQVPVPGPSGLPVPGELPTVPVR